MKNIIVLFTVLTALMSAKEVPSLSSEYLVGKWCLLYNKSPNGREEQNENWEFKKDGKFFQQTSQYNSTMKHRGLWKIQEGKLSIKPTFMGAPKPVTILSQDEFMMKFFVEMLIVRGACQK